MHVVLGTGPLARKLADALATDGSATLAGPSPATGRFLWRRADLETGEGVRGALHGAIRAYVVVEDPQATAHGVFLAARRGVVSHGVIVCPRYRGWPSGAAQTEDWARVSVPVVWGPDEPLVVAWRSRVQAGARLWLADPGPMPVVAAADAIAVICAAAERPRSRWSIAGEPATLPDLARAIATRVGTELKSSGVPLALMARRAGVPAARIRTWLDTQPGADDTGDWERPDRVGSSGWC